MQNRRKSIRRVSKTKDKEGRIEHTSVTDLVADNGERVQTIRMQLPFEVPSHQSGHQEEITEQRTFTSSMSETTVQSHGARMARKTLGSKGRSEAAKNKNETLGSQGRSAVTKKGNDTRAFNRFVIDYMDLSGGGGSSSGA